MLESKNAELKKLLAEKELEINILREFVKKQSLNQIISSLVSFGLPITRISKDFILSRSAVYLIITFIVSSKMTSNSLTLWKRR
ncbi:MAG: hypothetical protein ACP5U0_09570, partial [Caldisphaera sp.]